MQTDTFRGTVINNVLYRVKAGILYSRESYLKLPIQRKGVSGEDRVNAILMTRIRTEDTGQEVSLITLQNNPNTCVVTS